MKPLPKRKVHSYTRTLATRVLVPLFTVYSLLFTVSLASAQNLDFSSDELKRRALPAGASIPEDKSEGGCFWQKVLVQGAPPCEEPNIIEKLFGFLKEKFIGEQGFLNFIKPVTQLSATTSIGLASEQLRLSLYPAGQAPSGTSQYAAAGNIPSDLMEIFRKASTAKCVPMPMLLAIGEIEGGSMFNFTPEEIKRFSTPDWWVGASDEELKRGRCTNSCEPDPVNKCPAVEEPAIADVRGVMQFLIGTWQGPPEANGEGGHVPQIREALKQECIASGESENACQVWGSYKPQRCNLRDVIIGAAIKMRANSGTSENQCASWPENVVRNVASYYYGGKPSPDSCITTGGWNYCDKAWENYQKYSSSPPTTTQSQNIDLGENIPGLVHELVGISKQGKNIVAYKFGSGPATRRIAFVGGIHEGSPEIDGEANSRDFIIRAVNYFKANPSEIPPDTTAYFIPTMNPDGALKNSHCNASGVNLNRNWDIDFTVSASDKAGRYGCGNPDSGNKEFSEPENRAVRDFLIEKGVRKAIWYHSARPPGWIIPGTPSISVDFAKSITASIPGYQLHEIYDSVVTGDASDWFDSNIGPSVVVEFSKHTNLDSDEFNRNIEGMKAAMAF